LRDRVGSGKHARIARRSSQHPRRKELDGLQLVGRKYVRVLEAYLERLRAFYPHPNRVLFYDDVLIAYLLAFFNPAVRSLRLIEDLSRVPAINRHLSVDAVRRSTLSDANALFDPAHLLPLIDDLRARLPNLRHTDGDLATLLDKVVAIDGSFFRLAADVEWALRASNKHGESRYVRLNLAYSLRTGQSVGCELSGDDGRHEGTVAAASFIEPDQIYLFDSGVVTFDLLRTVRGRGGAFVCSLREQVNFRCDTQRVLDDKAKEAGVIGDRVGELTGSACRTPPPGQFREVRVAYTDRHGTPRTLRLLTSLPVDVPAHVVAALYKQRWQIELYFRWLKVHANFRHLTSHSEHGVTLSFYVAVIAQLLISLQTQLPMSRYGVSMMNLVANGTCDVEAILPILEQRHRERLTERARLAAKKRQKQKQAKHAEA